ncbi:MAG: redox-regulated ATPase YchF [Patescibacteria group bacterium]|nr:redox-regulated ATPase YchF [Patescibacteria group bacterium]
MLSVGIVGLPNIGKSTLFKALTQNPVDINNYPFCTIDPNVGIVPVEDQRLKKLSEIFTSKKTIPAVIEFIDIAGLVKGAHKGEGLGNKFLANIRDADLICHVVRCFQQESVEHVQKQINPSADIEVINTELILADLDTVLRRKHKTAKLARGLKDEEAQIELSALEKIEDVLNQGHLASTATLTREEKKAIVSLQLITKKPMLYILNVSQNNHPDLEKLSQEKSCIKLDIKTEAELLDLSSQEIKELELQSKISILPIEAYKKLNLITFFTAAEKESHAWTITKGSTAPQAGAKIHNDFKEKFIKAEVISYHDFIKVCSYKKAKEEGLIRTEGKDYTVRDGDIITFKI